MTLEGDAQSLENSFAGICDISSSTPVKRNSTGGVELTPAQSKYGQLLCLIEEMGKDIRISYAGNKSSTEKLKRGIVQANKLLRECLIETERSARM